MSWHLSPFHLRALLSLGYLGMEIYGSVLEVTRNTVWHSVGQDLVTWPTGESENSLIGALERRKWAWETLGSLCHPFENIDTLSQCRKCIVAPLCNVSLHGGVCILQRKCWDGGTDLYQAGSNNSVILKTLTACLVETIGEQVGEENPST